MSNIWQKMGIVKPKEEKKEPVVKKIFPPIKTEELIDILGLSIKSDVHNKICTFLCQLSAFSEDSQFNVSFNAPSSTGKSFIPMEIAKLFPKDSLIEVGYCSPTAFFHDHSKFDKELEQPVVDLERKIVIFLDQPHNLLLEHLRPVLSHDKKEILVKITDRSKRALRTKNILIRGFPSVIFCSAGLRIDEQEQTRFLLLSPEISQQKIKESIIARIEKESDKTKYDSWLESDPRRKELKERIIAIRDEQIGAIKIPKELEEKIKEVFLSKYKFLKPRHSRDVSRLLSLTKAFAILNFWDRKTGDETTCIDEDFNNALQIWEKIDMAQELNLPPFIFELYEKVVKPLLDEIGVESITRQEVCVKHFEIYGRSLSDTQLRKEILPMWELAGLIYQEEDPKDKRSRLIKKLNTKKDEVKL